MSDLKISQLPEKTTLDDVDIIPIVSDPSGTPVTKKITLLTFKAYSKGDTGAGVPTGGTTGQYLWKKSDTSLDTEWHTLDLSGYVPTTTTVNGHALSGNISVTTTDLSLNNVDNTSDATKNAAVATLTNKRYQHRVDSQTTTDTITPEISTYDIFIRTAQAHALVINNHSTSTPVNGEMMEFIITSDATPRAITYGDKYVAKAGVALPSTTVASKTTTLLFQWWAALFQWVLLASGQEA